MTTTTARAYAEQAMNHARQQYNARAPLPRCDGRHVAPCEELKTGRCVCDHQDGYRLTLMQLRGLFRAIMGEFAE